VGPSAPFPPPASLSFRCFLFQQSGFNFIRSSAISLAFRAKSSRFSSDNSLHFSPRSLETALLSLPGYNLVNSTLIFFANNMNPFMGRRSSSLPTAGFRRFFRGAVLRSSPSPAIIESGEPGGLGSSEDLSALLLLLLLLFCFIASEMDLSSLASLGCMVERFLWGYGRLLLLLLLLLLVELLDDFAE